MLPDGRLNATVVADDSAILATPPNIPSMATKFAFSADVPHAPTRSPVFGMINATLVVFGSGMATSLYVLGGVASGAGCFDDQPSEVNFLRASSTCADCNKLL